MANTSFLRREVEGYARARLAEEFGQPFASEYLTLRTGGRHEFDAVSADRSIVASVKSASGLTAGGRVPNGKIASCLAELYYLSLVAAPTRRLILTTPASFDIFTKVTSGAVAEGIEIVCQPLPARIQKQVDAIVREASLEVSPASELAAVAAEIEEDGDTDTETA